MSDKPPAADTRSGSTPTLLALLATSIPGSGCVTIATHAVRAMAGDQGGFFAGRLEKRRVTEAKCENLVAPITSGYGADEPHQIRSASVTGAGEETPLVFSPAASGRWPVIFLAHGHGPNYWRAYKDIVDHMVGRGLVVVYGTYPMRGVTNDQRYAALWSSFLAATLQFGDRIDLTRVGFVGHSFGGGATPALAYKGLNEQAKASTSKAGGAEAHSPSSWRPGMLPRPRMPSLSDSLRA